MQVPYRFPGSQYVQWVDIYTRMAYERIIFLDEAIDDSTANSVVALLLYLDSDDQTKPIYFYINSPGEFVSEGMQSTSMAATMAIYDTMQHIRSPVHTICLGLAYGTAALLLSSGTKGFRASLPNAEIVLAPQYGRTGGQATDVQIDARKIVADRKLLVDTLAANTGRSPEQITTDIDRRFYLTAEQAKGYGLIDRVLEGSKSLPKPVAAS
ncbi:MAG: ATP-dependent Clp protease proteolytic subunit [Leptolyngbya sp. IPPAS B-1204]|uniref:ATP-dependent Clp protease proteolytic subunit n=1 Tax=Leptolyngbya sp. NK1-12 TaxID=2547451 RepID=A0AA96WE52_9CYAN|nr:MAG: ATP-dependent Clp protease proteolytic subunit [Leptolyngbya sp. IPPAS B-1204]WNZ23584.1 ATP-dependent Clp protease proteolytic subunit [Leptolyngbya sp. NK1-12]